MTTEESQTPLIDLGEWLFRGRPPGASQIGRPRSSRIQASTFDGTPSSPVNLGI